MGCGHTITTTLEKVAKLHRLKAELEELIEELEGTTDAFELGSARDQLDRVIVRLKDDVAQAYKAARP